MTSRGHRPTSVFEPPPRPNSVKDRLRLRGPSRPPSNAATATVLSGDVASGRCGGCLPVDLERMDVPAVDLELLDLEVSDNRSPDRLDEGNPRSRRGRAPRWYSSPTQTEADTSYQSRSRPRNWGRVCAGRRRPGRREARTSSRIDQRCDERDAGGIIVVGARDLPSRVSGGPRSARSRCP